MPYLNMCKKCNHEWTTNSGPGINCPNCDAQGSGLLGFKYVEGTPEPKSESSSDTVKFKSETEGVATPRSKSVNTRDYDVS